jgi:hypothetical protein
MWLVKVSRIMAVRPPAVNRPLLRAFTVEQRRCKRSATVFMID